MPVFCSVAPQHRKSALAFHFPREQQARHEKVLDATKQCRFAYQKPPSNVPVPTGVYFGI